MALFSKKKKVEDFDLLRDKLGNFSETKHIPNHITLDKSDISLKEIKEFIDKDVDSKFEVFIEFLNEEKNKRKQLEKDLDLLREQMKNLSNNFQNNKQETKRKFPKIKKIVVKDEDLKFKLKNGTKLSSIDDLYNAITKMDDNVFHHHVNSERNDFVPWIQHIIKRRILAKRLEPVKERNEFIKILKDFLD